MKFSIKSDNHSQYYYHFTKCELKTILLMLRAFYLQLSKEEDFTESEFLEEMPFHLTTLPAGQATN